jgi:hypothetical protein
MQEILLSYVADHIGSDCYHSHHVAAEELPDYSRAVAEAEVGYSRIAEEEAVPAADSPGTLGVVADSSFRGVVAVVVAAAERSLQGNYSTTYPVAKQAIISVYIKVISSLANGPGHTQGSRRGYD